MVVSFFLTVVAATIVYSSSGESGRAIELCPPWMTQRDGGCICRYASRSAPAVICDSQTLTTFVVAGTCMTHYIDNTSIVICECPYIPVNDKTYVNRYLRALPENESELNDVICGPFNRQGLLCRSCRPGYGISVYSFGSPCAKCFNRGLGIFAYVTLELVPATLLYVVVLFFRIRATAAPLAGLVLFSHILINLTRGRIALFTSLTFATNSFIQVLIQMLLVLCGLWNLDFFRYTVPPFCVAENIENVHAVVLEYISAVYPLFLIFITIVAIKLHARNVRPIVWLGKPVNKCYSRFRKMCDIQRSVISAFSTFLLLSYTKILYVSFGLLYRTSVYNINGIVISMPLRLDPHIKQLWGTHAPIVLMAITFIVVFGFLPVLLLAIYPTRLFQKLIGRFRCRSVHAVHVFVDTYQGCFKDGTNGTRDYRAVSAVYLVLRCTLLCLYIKHNVLISSGITMIMFSIVFMVFSLLLAIFKLYKVSYCEAATLFHLGFVALFAYMWLFINIKSLFFATTLVIMCLVPHFALICYIFYVLVRGGAILNLVKSHIPQISRDNTSLIVSINGEVDLPHRFLHPDGYSHTLTDY